MRTETRLHHLIDAEHFERWMGLLGIRRYTCG
jgi:hypothetical protein